MLDELEALLNRETASNKKPSIYDMVGVITPAEAEELERIIKETSETIH